MSPYHQMTLPKGPPLVNRARSAGPPRSSVADYLTEQVLGLIREQRMRAGDRLPTVQEMARRCAVSVPTMREAMRRLEAVGIVDMRHGSGSYVLEGALRMVMPNPDPGPLESDSVIELLDARILIEPRLAELAGARATGSELAELGRLLGEAARRLSGDDEGLQVLNLSFHRAVAAMSGNRVLSHIIDSILDLYAGEQLVIMRVFANRAGDHQQHVRIQDALQSRSPELAGRLMRGHLVEIREVMRARLPGPRPRAAATALDSRPG